jgi:hypothetical protein
VKHFARRVTEAGALWAVKEQTGELKIRLLSNTPGQAENE